MGCSCTSRCMNVNATEKSAEFNNDDTNNIIKINETTDPKIIKSVIKLQSHYRGMKLREKFQLEDQFNITSQTIMVEDEELSTLLKTYPPLNDNIQVEIITPIEYPTTDTKYYGEWDITNNIRHGRGISVWPDGSKYLGYWVKDKANIKGKLIHSDGDIYEGEWIDDMPNGKGLYLHKDGTVYVGEWKNDKRNGFGKEKWMDGAWYEGEYKNGMKHGKGKFYWKDGSYYEGNFENDNINGKGVYIFNDKRKYEGNWKNNKLDGYGIFTWPNGRKYKGNYKNDKKEGYGEFFWENGKIYKGLWKEGKQNGEGKMFFPYENAWKKGVWENGNLVNWIDEEE